MSTIHIMTLMRPHNYIYLEGERGGGGGGGGGGGVHHLNTFRAVIK